MSKLPTENVSTALYVKPVTPMTCSICGQSSFAILYGDYQTSNIGDLQQRFISHSHDILATSQLWTQVTILKSRQKMWSQFGKCSSTGNRQWQCHAMALKLSAQIWDVSILLILHLLKLVTQPALMSFAWENISPKGRGTREGSL